MVSDLAVLVKSRPHFFLPAPETDHQVDQLRIRKSSRGEEQVRHRDDLLTTGPGCEEQASAPPSSPSLGEEAGARRPRCRPDSVDAEPAALVDRASGGASPSTDHAGPAQSGSTMDVDETSRRGDCHQAPTARPPRRSRSVDLVGQYHLIHSAPPSGRVLVTTKRWPIPSRQALPREANHRTRAAAPSTVM